MGVNLKGYGEWAVSQFARKNQEDVVYTAANIGWINENIALMNEAEIKEFVEYDYSEVFEKGIENGTN